MALVGAEMGKSGAERLGTNVVDWERGELLALQSAACWDPLCWLPGSSAAKSQVISEEARAVRLDGPSSTWGLLACAPAEKSTSTGTSHVFARVRLGR